MFFSIIIPTRDRPHLLKDAINSALNQEFDDYEVVVSDNSSNDESKKIVLNFDSKRLKYYRTPYPVDMCKSWEFALSKAKGKWILFLGDDDLLTSKTLKTYFNIIKSGIIDEEKLKIVASSWAVLSQKSNLYEIQFLQNEKKIKIVDAKEMLIERSMLQIDIIPHSSCIRKELYDFIRKKYGRVFFKWAPDLTSGFIALYELALSHEKYIKIEFPIWIARASKESYGYGARSNPEKVREFFSQFEDFEGKLLFSPFKKLFTLRNGILDTLLNSIHIVGEENLKKLMGEDNFRRFYRNTIRRSYMDIIRELEDISKYDKEYIKHIRIVKFHFIMWKIRNILYGIVRERDYVKEVIQSRARRFIKNLKKADQQLEVSDERLKSFQFASIKDAISFIESQIAEVYSFS